MIGEMTKKYLLSLMLIEPASIELPLLSLFPEASDTHCSKDIVVHEEDIVGSKVAGLSSSRCERVPGSLRFCRHETVTSCPGEPSNTATRNSEVAVVVVIL